MGVPRPPRPSVRRRVPLATAAVLAAAFALAPPQAGAEGPHYLVATGPLWWSYPHGAEHAQSGNAELVVAFEIGGPGRATLTYHYDTVFTTGLPAGIPQPYFSADGREELVGDWQNGWRLANDAGGIAVLEVGPWNPNGGVSWHQLGGIRLGFLVYSGNLDAPWLVDGHFTAVTTVP